MASKRTAGRHPLPRGLAQEIAETAGMPPRGYGGGMYDPDRMPLRLPEQWNDSDRVFARKGAASAGRRTTNPRGFNLRGVLEVLQDCGLDPTAEIAAILQAEKPVLRRNGEVVLDEQGEPLMEPSLDIDMRAKVLLELQQYVHPKLKAVEMTVKKPELTDEQIERRITALLRSGELGEIEKPKRGRPRKDDAATPAAKGK